LLSIIANPSWKSPEHTSILPKLPVQIMHRPFRLIKERSFLSRTFGPEQPGVYWPMAIRRYREVPHSRSFLILPRFHQRLLAPTPRPSSCCKCSRNRSFRVLDPWTNYSCPLRLNMPRYHRT